MGAEYSVGAVIKYDGNHDYDANGSEAKSQFLLMKNRRGTWGFPQGHMEKGESEIQTLLREVSEETGITSLHVHSYIGKIRYFYFRGDGMKSEKEVIFYFATTRTKQIKLSIEHADFKWVSLPEALRMLNHAQLRSIISKGHRRGLY